MDLEKIKTIAQKECDELNLQLISVKFYHDSEMGDMLEILIDKDYNITMDEIEAFTDRINPILDTIEELNIPYTLDISSGGSMREIPFSDTKKLIDKYLDITLAKSGETITAKVLSFEDNILNVVYFIKGRKKNLKLKEEEVKSIHMGYKA